jgi:hypothetical protein
MSDILCTVCGEPWDAYGVTHGDMLAWQAKLFRAGAGCPSCKGELPELPFEPESIFDLENGDGDEMERLLAYENRDARPPWKEPEPTVLWTCEGCGVEVVRDESECWLDGKTLKGEPIQYRVPPKAKCRQWYHSHDFDRGSPEAEPARTFGKAAICEFCLDSCEGCGAPVSSTLECGDVYDEGWCASTSDGHGVLCVECVGHEDDAGDEEQDDEEQDDNGEEDPA